MSNKCAIFYQICNIFVISCIIAGKKILRQKLCFHLNIFVLGIYSTMRSNTQWAICALAFLFWASYQSITVPVSWVSLLVVLTNIPFKDTPKMSAVAIKKAPALIPAIPSCLFLIVTTVPTVSNETIIRLKKRRTIAGVIIFASFIGAVTPKLLGAITKALYNII